MHLEQLVRQAARGDVDAFVRLTRRFQHFAFGSALAPEWDLLCLRPAAIVGAARRFIDSFPGDVLYAVKCTPEPRDLRAPAAKQGF